MNTSHIRIASGLGFYGDSHLPIRDSIERGEVDFVVSDHLAELTLAIVQKDRQRDPTQGYTKDILTLLGSLWPLMQAKGVRLVCNAGGLNPAGAGEALRAMFASKAWRARIAVVSGDDVLPALQSRPEDFPHLLDGQALGDRASRMVFANAYMGAGPIVEALDAGADIVITGRVADAALFLAPAIHALGWKRPGESGFEAADWDRYAQGLLMGHLMECSGQGSGGNFGAQGQWREVPDLAHTGYPIGEIHGDGRFLITKAPGTGGRVNFDTVRQQMLYEVHNPHAYLSPDVSLDMGTVRIEDEGLDRVWVSGATGSPPPEQLKVVGGYADGFKSEVTWGFSWPDAWDRAQQFVRTLRTQLAEQGVVHDELFVEHPGLNSAHGALSPLPEPEVLNELNEVWTRVVMRTPDKRAAAAFGRLLPWQGLSGPAYTCGIQGLNSVSQLLGIWPSLIDRDAVQARIEWVEVTA